VYAVAGRWTLDPSQTDRQGDALAGIVAGVRQLPGFVRGFWSRDVTDPSANLTWIVFETREQAEEFRRAVEQNAPAQRESGVARDDLVLVEVVAEA
jgi:quinol monooxygenase YgiN